MIDCHKVLLHALPGLLRVTICIDNGEPFIYEKDMSPTAMRVLSINLQQAALEYEQNLDFIKKV